MARILFSSIFTLFIFPCLFQLCQSSLISRAALIARNADSVAEANPEITNNVGSAIDKLQAELAAKLSFKDAAIRLLSGEGPKFARRHGRPRVDALEDIRQQLLDIDQMIADLRDLISDFLADITTTTTSTATSTPTAIATSAAIATSTATSTPTAIANSIATWISIAASTSSSTQTTTSVRSRSPTTVTTTPNNSRYVFDPEATDNVAVYYGQTDQSANVPLSTICNDTNVDIVILAFINKLSTGPRGLPGLNLGARGWAPTQAQVNAGGAALVGCVSNGFNEEVKACQRAGKKVLLSIGGAKDYSESTINSEEDAVRIAKNIWDLFGPGGLNNDSIMAIRPFGDLVLDGFDIDNEDGSTAHWPTLISTLRSYFLSYTSKPYYLGATPQCPRPDASIPLVSLQSQIDFIFIQFYNNPSCNLNATSPAGFLASLQAWSDDVGPDSGGPDFVNVDNGNTGPRVFVGAPSFPAAAGAGGFVGGAGFEDLAGQVGDKVDGGDGIENFGGFMFWDGAYGELSSAGSGVASTGLGKTWMQLAKEALA